MSQSTKERIVFTKQQREDIIGELIAYFKEERDEELGHLGAELLLRFVIEEIGPTIYNQGVRDAGRYLQRRLEDLPEIELYEAVRGE